MDAYETAISDEHQRLTDECAQIVAVLAGMTCERENETETYIMENNEAVGCISHDWYPDPSGNACEMWTIAYSGSIDLPQTAIDALELPIHRTEYF